MAGILYVASFELWAANRVPKMTPTRERIAIAASDNGMTTPGKDMCLRRRVVFAAAMLREWFETIRIVSRYVPLSVQREVHTK